MAGLALGNVLIGRFADSTARPIRLYRGMEAGIAVSGVLVTVLILEGDALMVPLASLASGTGISEPLVRFLMIFGALIIPATLMGGTVPVVARALARNGIEGRIVGWIYAANTTGAVLGALLPDLWLIPSIGMLNAALLAGCFNLVVVVLAGRMPEDELPPQEAAPMERAGLLAAALFAVSGFCAMGYEVIWSRIVEHLSGGELTGFAVLLATYLAMLAAGSWIAGGWADKVKAPLAWAAGLLTLTGASVLLILMFIFEWNGLAWAIVPREPGLLRESFGPQMARVFVRSLFLCGVPCVLMGAAFPFLAAEAVPAGSSGRSTGRLVAVNTLAGVAGAVATGFFILPAIGSQAALLALAATAIAVGAGAFVWTQRRHPARCVALLVVAVAALVGGSRLSEHHLLGVLLDRGTPQQILYTQEGSATTIAVAVQQRFGVPESRRELMTPGVSMSSTGFGARRYMGMMGHLPMFMVEDPGSALLICYGVGNTARSLLAHPNLERLDVVDISAEVFDASRYFAEVTGSDPVEDPRTEVFVDDGRHHLLVSGRTYDAITSEPPPPNHAGVVNLYSREYYATAKQSLNPGGILTQWLPVSQLSEQDILVMVAAFTAEFEHAAMFYGYRYQWILVGSDQPLVIDLAEWDRRAAVPAVAADLELTGIQGPDALLGAFMTTDEALRAVVEGVPPLSDNKPVIQYPHVPIVIPVIPEGLIGSPTQALPLVRAEVGRLEQSVGAVEAANQLLLAQGVHYRGPEEWREVLLGGRVHLALAMNPGDPTPLAVLNVGPDLIDVAPQAPDDPLARFQMGRRHYYKGDYAEAERAFASVSEDQVDPALYWLLRGGAQRALGDLDAAVASLERSREVSGYAPFNDWIGALIAQIEAPILPAGPLARP